MNQKMPVLFVGHGSPMNAVAENSFTSFLSGLGATLPRPRAILVISAHWETARTQILSAPRPRTIHDFGGFPRALYEIQYPAPGEPALAADLASRLGSDLGGEWGFDHGTWSILHHLYPRADVPVIQLSLGEALGLPEHYALGERLSPLREQGVLILASGNITHNLRELAPSPDAPAAPWAVAFDAAIAAALDAGDVAALTGGALDAASWRLAHPQFDHYIPLLYAAGAGRGARPSYPFTGFQHGSLSMRAVRFD